MRYYDRIRGLREDSEPKMTQSDLAKILNTNQRKISRIETGESEPSINDLILICRYFNVSADYILGLSDKYIDRRK